MEQILAYLLNRPVTCLMILTSMILLGCISLSRLPLSLMPPQQSSGITIVTSHPGISAEKIEDSITIPLEKTLSDIPDTENILSVSEEGESRISLIFSDENNTDHRILDASEKIQLIRKNLPGSANDSFIMKYDPSGSPVYIATFKSDILDTNALREYVENNLKHEYENIEGVSRVETEGGLEREVRISFIDGALFSGRTDPEYIAAGIQNSNLFMPLGSLRTDGIKRRIFMNAKFRNTDDIGNLNIYFPAEGGIKKAHLKEFAEVRDSHKAQNKISRTNGRERVGLFVYRESNSNAIHIGNNCRDLTLRRNSLLKGHENFNYGHQIEIAVKKVISSAAAGCIIAALFLYLFLRNLRATLIVSLSLPSSILTAFFFMDAFQISINIMSLSGIALGAGMLVDNSIILLESIENRKSFLSDPRERILAGSAGVAKELTASTATTLIVFIPLLFSNPEIGHLFRDLVLTVTFSLLISLFISLTVTPSFILLAENGIPPFSFLFRIRGSSLYKIFMYADQFLFLPVSLFLNTLLERFIGAYRKSYKTLFQRKKNIIFLSILYMLISIPAFLFSGKSDGGVIPDETIHGSVELKTGIHLTETEKIVSEAEKIISEHPDVSEITTSIQKSHADLHIKIKPEKRKGKSHDEYISDFTNLTKNVKNSQIYFHRSESDPSSELDLEFYGKNSRELRETVHRIGQQIQKEIRGVENVIFKFKDPAEHILVTPDRAKLQLNAFSSLRMGEDLNTAFTGKIVSKLYENGSETDIRLQGDRSHDSDIKNLNRTVVWSGEDYIHLNSLTEITKKEGENILYRKNRRKFLTMTLRIKNRSVDRVAEDIIGLLHTISLPDDITFSFSDHYIRMMKNHMQMAFAIFSSILLIYFLLGALFESFRLPFIIMLSAPLTIATILNIYFILDIALDLSILIGLLILTGILVNTSILLVSAVRAVNPGAHDVSGILFLKKVFRRASERIRPVFITTLTTISTLIPMSLDFSEGSAMWRNIAVTEVLGLIISTVINLFLIPVFYPFFHETDIK